MAEPRRIAWLLLAAAAAAAGLYVLLPQIAGLDETWGRLADGDPFWLVAAVLLEVASYGGYVLLFRGVFARRGSPVGWRESYQITMAGVMATRLFATAGAGGVVLTGWALGRLGMERRQVVEGLTTFLVSLYATYMAALVVTGVGLRTGLLSGPAPFAVTVVPALFGGLVIAAALVLARLHRRIAIAAGVRGAVGLLRRRDPALVGSLVWWACDVAVLWACFRAFGDTPPVAVIVMAYFTGMLGNVLPLPGGVGGVEGGMIGVLLAFDVTAGLAVVAVLSYRAVAFWLPMVPGASAYLQLRRTVKGLEPEEPLHEEGRVAYGRPMEEPATNINRTGVGAIVDYLDGEGVSYELVEHEETMTAAAEASATARPPDVVAKTVVLHDDRDGYLIAAVPASARLDLRKLREVLGATSALRLATEEEMARDFPRIEVGATPPFGPMLPRAEVIDRRLVEEDKILCAAGDHRHSVLVDPRDIVRMTSASTADICEDEY